MAGGPTPVPVTNPKGQAYNAGAKGQPIPPGLDISDPDVTEAHARGKAGQPFRAPIAPPKGRKGPGSPARRSSSSKRGARPSKRANSSRSSKPTVLNPTGGRLPISIGAGTGAAGVFFGAIGYALVLSVAEYGPSGPLLWFKAKFLNQAAPAPSK